MGGRQYFDSLRADGDLTSNSGLTPQRISQICEWSDRFMRRIDELPLSNEIREVFTNRLVRRLQENSLTLQLPNVTVGVAGETGKGKSTLLNAILGSSVLPDCCVGATSQNSVSISRAVGQHFTATIQFVNRSQIEQDLIMTQETDSEKEPDESMLAIAERLGRIFDREFVIGQQVAEPTSLDTEIESLLSQRSITITVDSMEALAETISVFNNPLLTIGIRRS
jgi:ATPase subunit of ABC transporter with duplicated ATPase domains